MAEAFPQDVFIPDDLMTCCICEKTLRDPKLLPCQHSCCLNCLKERVSASDSSLSCPNCERSIDVSNDNLDQLPDNFLFCAIDTQRAALQKSDNTCIPCQIDNKTTKATHQCLDCPDTFCSNCKKFHIYPSLTRNHRVVEIKDIQAGKYNKEIKQKQIKLCPEHSKDDKNIQLDFYCEDCQCCVCQHCVILKHKSHTCSTLDAFDDQVRLTLRQKIQPLEEKEKREATFSDRLDNNVQALDKEKEVIENKIHEAATELHDLVDKIKEEKLEYVQNHIENEKTKSKETKRMNQLKRKQTDAVKSFAEAFLHHSSKVDFVSHFKDVETRVKECIDRKEDYIIATKHLNIKIRPCIEAKDIIEDVLGEMSMTEKTTDEYGKVCIREDTSDKSRKAVHVLKEICKPEKLFYIEQGMSNSDGISVTAANEVITIQGTTVYIYSDKGMLKKSFTCEDLKWSYDLTTRGCFIYVTDIRQMYRKILVVDEEGALQKTIKMPQNEQSHEGCNTGVAVDENGNVYIASISTSIVYKCKSQSTIPGIFLSNSSNSGINGPIYLCVSHKQALIVSNYGSNNIQAYNMNAQLIWQYDGTKGLNKTMALTTPFGVCSDKEGYVYVCDSGNHRIQIVKDGKFLNSIQCPQKLQSPRAITITINNELIITGGGAIVKLKVWK